jgi:hypothetical protein
MTLVIKYPVHESWGTNIQIIADLNIFPTEMLNFFRSLSLQVY